MFPLQLLALFFISSLRLKNGQEVDRKDGQEVDRKDGQEVDRKDGQEVDRKDGQGVDRKDGQEVDRKLTLQRGDLLEVPRTLFTHFGIYLGGNRVAHFIPDIMPVFFSDQSWISPMVTNTRLLLGVLAKRGSIRVDSVDDFAYGAEILVNTFDKVCGRPALRGQEVALRAEKLQGHTSYSLLWYNCEHYVTYCRYGAVVSFQTFQFCKTARKLLLSRRVAKVTAVLGACLLLYLGPVNTWSVLLAVLLPFLIWMAS